MYPRRPRRVASAVGRAAFPRGRRPGAHCTRVLVGPARNVPAPPSARASEQATPRLPKQSNRSTGCRGEDESLASNARLQSRGGTQFIASVSASGRNKLRPSHTQSRGGSRSRATCRLQLANALSARRAMYPRRPRREASERWERDPPDAFHFQTSDAPHFLNRSSTFMGASRSSNPVDVVKRRRFPVHVEEIHAPTVDRAAFTQPVGPLPLSPRGIPPFAGLQRQQRGDQNAHG